MRGWAWLLALAVALPLVVGVAGLPPHDAPDAPIHTHVGARYLERGVEETGMKNLVTAVLLNYRGFDTFIEVVVIFTALAAVLALPRGAVRPASRRRTEDGRGTGDPGVADPDAAAGADAGRLADVDGEVPVSPVVGFVVRLLAPFMALFAIAMLFRGHVTPGGGFQAAAVFAAIFIALGLVMGRARVGRLVSGRAQPWLQAAGPLAFAAVAWAGWRLTGHFLGYPMHDHTAQEAMALVLEVAIGVGGGVILARLFLSMET